MILVVFICAVVFIVPGSSARRTTILSAHCCGIQGGDRVPGSGWYTLIAHNQGLYDDWSFFASGTLSSATPRDMVTKKLRAVHPGDILLHDFMKPLGLSAYRLAKELGVTAPTVNEIVRRRRAVTAEMALRLSRYFGTTAQLWQNLQSQYDLEIAQQKIGRKVQSGIQPLARPDLTGHEQAS